MSIKRKKRKREEKGMKKNRKKKSMYDVRMKNERIENM